jgi:CrcB protein
MRKLVLLASVGAAIGSSARYGISLAFPTTMILSFPWPTLLVNLLGSFLIGLVSTSTNLMEDESKRAFYITGVLGGFTTFSALAVETVDMVSHPLSAIGYLILTFAGGLLFAQLGVMFKVKSTR